MKKNLFLDSRTVRFAARAPEGDRPVSGASAEHLTAINALPGVLTTLTAADVYVRECEACNDQPLKNGLRLGVAELAQIAALSPGKGVHRNHDTWTAEGGLPIGRIFAARMESSEGRSVVMQTFYILATDEGTELVRLIDGGAISEVSVSFMYDELLCSICRTSLYECAHMPLEVYEGKMCEGLVLGVNEYLETSLVWQGMANDTRIKMAASRRCLCGDSDLADYLGRNASQKSALRNLAIEWDEKLAAAPETGMGWHLVVITFENGATLSTEVRSGAFECPAELADVAIVNVEVVPSIESLFRVAPLESLFGPEKSMESLFTK